MKTSPTARSMAALKATGYLVDRVEHWNPFARQRKDLYGIIDLVAIHKLRQGVLGVQATTGPNVAARIAKAREREALVVWLMAGNRFHVHGWRKVGGRGERKLWACRIVELKLDGGEIVEVEE